MKLTACRSKPAQLPMSLNRNNWINRRVIETFYPCRSTCCVATWHLQTSKLLTNCEAECIPGNSTRRNGWFLHYSTWHSDLCVGCVFLLGLCTYIESAFSATSKWLRKERFNSLAKCVGFFLVHFCVLSVIRSVRRNYWKIISFD